MFNHENLKGRVAVVTGGGGVLCGGLQCVGAGVYARRAGCDCREAGHL